MNIADNLKNYLQNKTQKEHKILNLESLSGGACQENYLVDLEIVNNSFTETQQLVLRTDKGGSLFSSLSRAEEFMVCELAYNHVVKTPKPILLETNSSIIGNPFYLMEKISGKANGRYIVKSPELAKIRKQLPKILAYELSKIHSIQPKEVKDERLQQKLLGNTNLEKKNVAESAIKNVKIQIEKLPEPHPAMELIINWLEANQPETDEIVLVHGDFRTGNFMVTPEELTGIIDWEFAHFGDRHEDIAWLCVRDWRFGKLKLEAGGFATRQEFYEEYKKYFPQLDEKKVLFWEVMGNLRWAIGSVEQAERHILGLDRGIELASIGRRTCEMEWEAMRLVENAR